jgi:hypothetical protein
MTISNVKDEIHLKMRLLSIGRGISMAELVSQLVNDAWSSDKTVPDRKKVRWMKRLIKKWRP